MSWLYLFLTTIIGLTECQTLVSYSECPMVDELLLKTFEEKTKLEIEISNLRGHVDHLHREMVHLEKLFKSILIQSKCRPFTFGLMCEPCRCNKRTTEVCDYETGRCKCKPGFQGERCNCVKGKHQCNLTSSYCSYDLVHGSPACICRDGFRMSSGYKLCEQDPADVIFIIDKSSSLMTEINLQKELFFVMSVIETLDIGIGSCQTRVGVISFSTDAMLEVGLGKYSSKRDLERKLLYVDFSRGDAYTHKAIDIMLDEFANARRNVKRIGVVITNGGSTDPYSLKHRLVKVRSQRITMFAIGVGDAVNQEELSDIGSDPDETYVWQVENLDALGSLNLALGLKRCSPA